jgi:dihydrofolate reductase
MAGTIGGDAEVAGTSGAGITVPPGRSQRSVVVSTFVTLDGYMVGPDEDMSWAIEGFDAEMQSDIAQHMAEDCDCFVFGRETYDIFAAYWPNAISYAEGDAVSPAAGREDPRIIRALNESEKVVFTWRPAVEPAWSNTRMVSAEPAEEVRRLKSQPGRSISVQGSASIVQALQAADAVDEYRLYLHPVLLGAGKRLLAEGPGRQDFELLDCKQYRNGVLALRYGRKAVAG